MTITAIKEKLHEYIDSANEANVMELYGFVKQESNVPLNYWEDDNFVAEMQRRLEEYKSGIVKGVSWEDVKRQAREITE